MRDWDQELAPDERDEIIGRIARAISRRRMEMPAVLFLEMHKPLSFVASQALIAGSPFLAPVVGLNNLRGAVKLLERRENVELLIRRIEEHAASPDAGREPHPEAP